MNQEVPLLTRDVLLSTSMAGVATLGWGGCVSL